MAKYADGELDAGFPGNKLVDRLNSPPPRLRKVKRLNRSCLMA